MAQEDWHTLSERVYLTAAGQATTKEGDPKAVTLLGGPGKRIPMAQAIEIGLVKKSRPKARKSGSAEE